MRPAQPDEMSRQDVAESWSEMWLAQPAKE